MVRETIIIPPKYIKINKIKEVIIGYSINIYNQWNIYALIIVY